MDVLRDYQQEMLDRLHGFWAPTTGSRRQSVMVQMPTGTGKTHLMAAVIREYADRGVLVVAHRRELIEQISQTLDRFGVEHGLIINGEDLDATKKVQVASIQTLTRRLSHTDSTDGTDNQGVSIMPSLVVVDEAHHALAKTYRLLWERWPEARFLGLTATPCRLSGEPFTDLFDVLVQSWNIVQFIRKGWLSDVDYVSVRSDSITMRRVASLNKRGANGDYQTKQMVNVLDVPESIAHLFNSYRKYADGKKGIVYAINQEHALHIAEYYQAHGVNCCMIDANTPRESRMQWVEDYRQGKIDVLVNVDIFSSGFDCPEVEFIQLARPTLSLALYLQQIGRGMRVSSGKSKVTILDQVGLWLVFGLPTSDWNWKEMFVGKKAGKGKTLPKPLPMKERGIGEEKILVNEEMFRIKTLLSEIGTQEKGKAQQQKEQKTVTGTEAHSEMMGGLPFIRVNKDGSYILKGDSGFKKRFRREDVIYNDCLTIIGDDLFVKSDSICHYQVAGYHGDCVLARTADGLLMLGKDGRIGQTVRHMPADVTQQPDFQLLGLQRESAVSVTTGVGAESLMRDYQREMFANFWNSGRMRKKVLLQIPIGTGKTWMAVPVIRKELKTMSRYRFSQAKKVLIVTHTAQLVGQIADALERCAIKCRLMKTVFYDYWDHPDVTIATTTFIQQELDSIDDNYEPTLIVFDEAHLIPAEVYDKLYDRWPEARYLGLTATPVTGNGLVLKKIYSQFVPAWSLRRLIDNGWLKAVQYIDEGLDERIQRKLASLVDRDEQGDYPDGDMALLLDTPEEVERLCLSYLKHADGRRGIVCAINQQHARHIAECYRKHGVKAAACMDLTSLEGRQQVENLRNGNLKVLVEVRHFSDGLRCPDIDFVQLARPTCLLSTYLHQVGCGMRVEKTISERNSRLGTVTDIPNLPNDQTTKRPNYNKLMVLDHVGAKEAFGLPTDDRDWNLLFAGGKATKVAKDRAERIAVKKDNGVLPPTTNKKWQLRMQRLVGYEPSRQPTTDKR